MKKTVLLVSNLYGPNIGGVENSLYYLAQAYISDGYSVVICVSDIHSGKEPLSEEEVVEGVKIYRYRVNKYRGAKRFIFHWLNALSLMKKLRSKYQPDIVISRFHQSCILLDLAGFRSYVYLIPGIVKFQNSKANLGTKKRSFLEKLADSSNFKLNVFLQKLALSKAQTLGVFSEQMVLQVRNLKATYLNKLFVTKPGVDTDRFLPGQGKEKLSLFKELGCSIDQPLALCLGRYVGAKGFDLAIEAMAKNSKGVLLIVGQGNELHHYERLVARHSLKSRVFIMPPSSVPEYYYKAADFFVMSSRYEPLGQTILEALSSGLPMIAFRSGGEVNTATEELLGKQEAIYAETLSVDALANAMKHAFSLYKTETYDNQSRLNRQLAIEGFSWNKLSRTLAEKVSTQ